MSIKFIWITWNWMEQFWFYSWLHISNYSLIFGAKMTDGMIQMYVAKRKETENLTVSIAILKVYFT